MDGARKGSLPLQVFVGLASVAAAAPWAAAGVSSSGLPAWLYAVGVVGFVVGVLPLPLLVLPTAAAPGSVSVRAGRLVARTTRGRRELSLGRLSRVLGAEVPGRFDSSVLLWLRDVDGHGVLLVGRTFARPIPSAVTAAVRALDRRTPRRVSRGARRALGLDPEPGVLVGALGYVGRSLALALVVVAAAGLYVTGLLAVAGAPR